LYEIGELFSLPSKSTLFQFYQLDLFFRVEIFKFAAGTRKMLPSYSLLCEVAFDAVDAVKLEIG
jgi:hypothetical protein